MQSLLSLVLFVFVLFATIAIASPDVGRQFVAISNGEAGRQQLPLRVCNRYERGPDLEAKQQDALANFVYLIYEQKEVRKAFDRWVPGEYIQHDPQADQGREFAINTLTKSLNTPGTSFSNFTVFGGQGYGGAHYKITAFTEPLTVFDYFRFEGTCIVEHWNILQVITGNEVNSFAFF